jgi:ABC-2 type transport system ATP-binding protein
LFHAAYHGVPRAERTALADEILEKMGLADHKKALVDTLSGGQAQRLMIARALMHRPKVLFLDEPSTGLDPQARLFVHERVQQLHEDGVTVVLTTHDMDEAAKLCNRVGIVDHGKLLTLDTPEELTRSLPGSQTVSVTVNPNGSGPEPVTKALSEVDGVQRVEEVGNMFRVYTDVDTSITLPAVLQTLQKLDLRVSDLAIGKPSLEDVFIHLTGRELR